MVTSRFVTPFLMTTHSDRQGPVNGPAPPLCSLTSADSASPQTNPRYLRRPAARKSGNPAPLLLVSSGPRTHASHTLSRSPTPSPPARSARRGDRVRLDCKTYNPVLHQADLPVTEVPWWGGRTLRFEYA